MTVTTDISKVNRPGNGTATVFSFSPVRIFEAEDLVVLLTNSAGETSTLVEGETSSNYSVQADFPGTGSITYPATGGTPVPNGSYLTIWRRFEFLQETRLRNQGGYFADVQEAAFDRLTMYCQQLQEELERSLRAGPQDDGTTDWTVPPIEAGKFLGANPAGTALQWSDFIVTQASAANTTPAAVSLVAGAVGVATTFARGDHAHKLTVSADVADILNAANNAAIRSELGLGSAALLTAGTGTGNVPVLAGPNQLPALDGSLLTGLAGGFSMFPGALQFGACISTPSGWLYCDGSAVSRVTYSTLFAAMRLSKGSVTINLGTDVFTNVAHGLNIGDRVVFTTSGALPTGLTAGISYFVRSVPTADTLTLSATLGGGLLDVSGSQSGTHTMVYQPFGHGDGSTTFNLPDMRGRVPIGTGDGTATGHTLHSLAELEGAETVALIEANNGPHTHTLVNALSWYNGSGSSGASQPTSGTDGATLATQSIASSGSGTPHNNLQPSTAGNWYIKI